MPLHTHKILVICGSEKKRALIFVEKCGRGGEIKKFGKMHKFAEICLLCQKREFFTIFHHSNENGSSSANFEARPLILFANENLEQALIFCFSTWGH